jgi:glucose/arabinose dehydrogenase
MFRRAVTLFAGLSLAIVTGPALPSGAQGSGPTMLHPNLAVKTVVSGLTTPTSLAFLGPNDIFVLEKNTGRVLRVVEGVVGPAVLDLAVNFTAPGLPGHALRLPVLDREHDRCGHGRPLGDAAPGQPC